ncbi:MAG: ATP phosphoribosyltransferase, partial [Rhodospirillales bacterium]|nr:ATP phosphoribosyltransferase [Rhodospirillales bacterium]
MSAQTNDKLVLALPKGRILEEVMPLVRHAGIEPEAAFDDSNSR